MRRNQPDAALPAADDAVVYDAGRRQWLQFRRPVAVLEAYALGEVMPVLRTASDYADRGLYAAGFMSYEAAPAFDRALQVRADGQFPLAWFGIYEGAAVLRVLPGAARAADGSLEWCASIPEERYRRRVERVRACIEAGETYQVNFSWRLRADAPARPWAMFARLVSGQSRRYAAFVDTGAWTVCSASPELFFRLDGRRLVSRPMKGTAPRGLTCDADRALGRWLTRSAKNRAENVMIVDMVRNDMGRIAETGSVRAPHLFEPERYPTLWQLTSTVECRTGAPVADIFRALFPAASITGAPKVRTMALIAELEDSPRRVYTGAMGFIGPARTAQFNVAIRTVLVDRAEKRAEYGVGGGIVWDSEPGEEYRECRIKAGVLFRRKPAFRLLETMLWSRSEGVYLLERHLERMRASADYFGMAFDEARARARLEAAVRDAAPEGGAHLMLRLLLSRSGRIECQVKPFAAAAAAGPVRARLAPAPVNAGDVFLYHKTTRRSVYKRAARACPDADDVLLWNADGELTEFCTANAVVELGGILYTPPVSSGLLAGTFRAHLLAEGVLREKTLRRADLRRATRIFAVNSVRKWRPVCWLLDDRATACRS